MLPALTGHFQAHLRKVRRESVFLLASIAFLLPLAFYNMRGWILLLAFPGDANAGEGILLFEARRLFAGQNIYGPISNPPYWIAPYPPLYHFLIGPFAWEGFLWPRLVTLAGTVTILVLFVVLLNRLTRTPLAGLAACGLWINSPCVNAWSAICRVDITGRALESAGIACALLLATPCRALYWSILFCTLAMLTKQNFIAGGIVCFWILLNQEKKTGLLFAIGWVAATLAAYLLLSLATSGGFAKHTFAYASRGIKWDALRYWLLFFRDTHYPCLAAALPGLWYAWRERQARWLLVAVAAGLPTVVMSGNDGGDRNYFFDLLWPLCMLVPFGIVHLCRDMANRRSSLPNALIAMTTVACIAWGMHRNKTLFRMPYPGHNERKQARKIIRTLKRFPGPVLSEYVGFPLLAGKKVECAPFIMKQAEASGQWDPEPVVRRIEKREYGSMLLLKNPSNRFPDAIVRAIESNYQPVRVFPQNYLVEDWLDYYLYRPKTGKDSKEK